MQATFSSSCQVGASLHHPFYIIPWAGASWFSLITEELQGMEDKTLDDIRGYLKITNCMTQKTENNLDRGMSWVLEPEGGLMSPCSSS
jgi:hypothetical protein